MNKETKIAYTEVLEVLSKMDIKYKKKIPTHIIEFMEKNKTDNYFSKINVNIPLKQQGLTIDSLAILSLFILKYWSEDENEKKVNGSIYK